MELHEILSTLREEKDMKQHEVAEKVHVTKSAISSYGTGSSQPSYSVLVALADLYDVSIDFLLGRTQMRLPFHYFEQGFKTETGVFPLNSLYNLSCTNKDLIAKLVIMLYEMNSIEKNERIIKTISSKSK